MRLISAQGLKEKLDRGDPMKLVNALGDWEYQAAHIPGSLHFSTPEETLKGSTKTTRSSFTARIPPVWPASRCTSSWSGTAIGTFGASLAACRSGSRQGIRWRGRWWMRGRPTQDLSSVDAAATPTTPATPHPLGGAR
jgi:hypothetical protein